MTRRLVKAIFIILFSLACVQGAALEFSEDFSSLTRFESGAVWNSALGRVHSPFFVYQYLDGSRQNRSFSIGDGRHGAFTSSRYAEFSSGGNLSGQVIRLNTDSYPDLQFTTFSLDPGWTLRPEGSKPLIVRVLGQVTVGGDIDCSGEAGQDLNGDPAVVTQGGIGRCGGGRGGNGGSSSVNAEDGFAGGPFIPSGVSPGVDGPTAGRGGAGTGLGGGGGATYVASRGAGYDPLSGSSGAGGAPGLMAVDNDFDYEGGGFGGGGGSFYGAGSVAQNSAGGAGGGGGGLIWFMAGGDVILNGDVLANGGDGGTGTAGQMAGGGGGGAGGAIAVFSGGDVTLSGGSVVSADRGRGRGPAGRLGGDAAVGRTWLVGRSGYALGGPPFEFPTPSVTDVGVVAFEPMTITVTSREFDLMNTEPVLNAVNVNHTLPGGSSLDVFVASGDSGFTPSWQNVTGVPITLKRYARFQLVLNSTSVATPAFVEELSFDLTGKRTKRFEFISACGAVGGGFWGGGDRGGDGRGGAGGPGAMTVVLWLASALLPLLILIALKRRARREFLVSPILLN